MIQLLESFVIFAHSSSMAEAAVKLRISQSALSKRISSLENQIGYALIKREGRRARLTENAVALLDEAEPVIAKLKDVIRPKSTGENLIVDIALADAIMVSWGAELMVRLQFHFADINFRIHSHRTAMVTERLKQGQYQLGLCTGDVTEASGLIVQPLVSEPMAIVISNKHIVEFNLWKEGQANLGVLCIEQKSSMWRWLEPHLHMWKISPTMQMESSVGAARLAVQGFGHALVPYGVAKIIAPKDSILILSSEMAKGFLSQDFPNHSVLNQGLTRPCSLISRKTVLNEPALKGVFEMIKSETITLMESY